MTKPVTRRMAVDCLLHIVGQFEDNPPLIHGNIIFCPVCFSAIRAGHAECHKIKTAQDVKANAKVKRLANPKPSRHPMQKTGRKLQSMPWPK